MGLGGGRHLQGRAGLELWEPALRGWRPLSEPDNERKEALGVSLGRSLLYLAGSQSSRPASPAAVSLPPAPFFSRTDAPQSFIHLIPP